MEIRQILRKNRSLSLTLAFSAAVKLLAKPWYASSTKLKSTAVGASRTVSSSNSGLTASWWHATYARMQAASLRDSSSWCRGSASSVPMLQGSQETFLTAICPAYS